MILRALKKQHPYEFVKKRGITTAKAFSEYYTVVAYDVRVSHNSGRALYYMHHIVADGLSLEETIQRYGDLKIGSLHNHSVEEEVIKKITHD